MARWRGAAEMVEGRVLVTGGTGSIGSEIVRQLLDRPAVEKVVVFSRDEIKQFLMWQELEDERLELVMGDIRSHDSLENVFERGPVSAIFHAAAMKHVVACEREPMECALTNITGTHNLVRLALKYEVPRLLTISTDKAAAPSSTMGAAKFIAERLTLNGQRLAPGAKWGCVRFGNVANSRGSVIPVLAERAATGRDLKVSDPEVTRFVMRIADAVRLVLHVCSENRGGELFILKMDAFRLGDLVEVMQQRIAPALGHTVAVVETGLFPGEKLHEELLHPVELPHLWEDEELFVVRQDDSPRKGFRRVDIAGYDSSQARRLTPDELERLVREYLASRNLLRDA